MSEYITIPLSKTGKHAGKYETIVSLEDADLVASDWQVYKKRNGRCYATRFIYYDNDKRRMLRLHRVVMERVLDRKLTPKEYVDHINGDGLDNRRENLRVASNSQNLFNRGKQRNNTSGYKGVTAFRDKWVAQIWKNRQRFHLGVFDTPEEAYDAYCAKAKELHGKFANLD